ncbi:MAG: hypothetical protein K2X82_30955 [Gemmataceae bacterium]|nr:hypothetical protein [Gemmataceae bacterium]
MTRYEIRGREPHTAIVVGWDPPLATFFAQVWDERIESEKEEPELLWVGCFAREVPTVDDLAARVAPFVTLTPEFRQQLARDREREPGRAVAPRK